MKKSKFKLSKLVSFYDYLQKKGDKLKTNSEILEFLDGKECVVLTNTNGHNYGVPGDSFIAITAEGSGAYVNNGGSSIPTKMTSINHMTEGGNNIHISAFAVIVEVTPKIIQEGIEYRRELISNLNAEIEEEENKLVFLSKKKLKQFKDEEYLQYIIEEKLSDTTLSDKEKAEQLTAFLK